LPRICLRYFVRRGISMVLLPALDGRHEQGVGLVGDLALVDPALHADDTERRPRLRATEVDVRAQRVQRHLALQLLLHARHLGATQATADLDAAPQRPALHGPLY